MLLTTITPGTTYSATISSTLSSNSNLPKITSISMYGYNLSLLRKKFSSPVTSVSLTPSPSLTMADISVTLSSGSRLSTTTVIGGIVANVLFIVITIIIAIALFSFKNHCGKLCFKNTSKRFGKVFSLHFTLTSYTGVVPLLLVRMSQPQSMMHMGRW